MNKVKRKIKRSYTKEFKQQAIGLANEIGVKEAAEKLGIDTTQSLANWVRYDKKISEDVNFRKIEELIAENKRLKKELDCEKKSVAILRDAAAFFCQDHLK